MSNRKNSRGFENLDGTAADADIDQAKAALAVHHLARKFFLFFFITLKHRVE